MLASLFVVAFAGCLGPVSGQSDKDTLGSAPLVLAGRAEYDVAIDGESRGAMTTDAVVEENILTVRASLKIPIPKFGGSRALHEGEFEVMYDMATGAMLSTEVDHSTWFPWNEHALWQVPVGLWTFGGRGMVERGIIPLSPILAAWNSAQDGSIDLSTIGPMNGSWEQGAAWTLQARGGCRIDCLGNGVSSKIWLNATGTDSVFPERFTWMVSHEEWHGTYVFNRSTWTPAGAPYDPSGQRLVYVPAVNTEACGLSLCEGPEWDPHYSIQDALDALYQTQEWQTWSTAHPNNWPTSLSVGHSGAGVSTQELVSLSGYTLFFVADDQSSRWFQLRQVSPPTSVGGPIVLQDEQPLSQVEDPEQFRRQAWKAPPADAIRAMASDAKGDRQFRGLSVVYDSMFRVASAEDQVQVRVRFVDDDQRYHVVRVIPAFAHVAETYALTPPA